MRNFIFLIASLGISFAATAQNVGIGTTSPLARLHVADSNVVFTGPAILTDPTNYNPPIQGAGTRMMWYPQKAAFRVGAVTGNNWDKDSIGLLSFASGYDTLAKGIGSIAIGVNAYAAANYSNAIGGATKAGDFSTAIGIYSTAPGQFSIAMGYQVAASENRSIAIGINTTASGFQSTAIGNHATASAELSTSMGLYTTASGYQSTAMGYNTNAFGERSSATGAFTSRTTTLLVQSAGFPTTRSLLLETEQLIMQEAMRWWF
ncbi:MAG: hypothetical protein ABIX01_24320 [Chitinophagaceae bacterium]